MGNEHYVNEGTDPGPGGCRTDTAHHPPPTIPSFGAPFLHFRFLVQVARQKFRPLRVQRLRRSVALLDLIDPTVRQCRLRQNLVELLVLPDEVVTETSRRYLNAFERITGAPLAIAGAE